VQRLLTVGAAAVVVIAAIVLLDRTVIGRAMESVAADEQLATLYGVRVFRLHLLAWGAAGLCYGVTGILQAGIATVSETLALPFLVTALVAAVLGGIGSLRATAMGVVLVAVVSTIVQQLLNVQLPLTPVFVLLLIGLAIRPAGLFARVRTGERA